MLRALSTVGGFTMISRFLGLLREIFMAAFLGTGPICDAFYLALRLPNMFRRIFGEGAFNSAFVPLFGRDLAEGNTEVAHRFARTAFAWLAVVLTLGSLLIIPLMPWFGRLIAPFAGPEIYEPMVSYGRIMFSYLLCMALSAHLSGVLNTLKVFSVPAAAPILLNILMLIVLAIIVPLAHLQGDLYHIGELVSWSVCAAGFAQLILLWVTCWRKGVRITLVMPRMTPRVRRLGVLMGPGVIAAGIQQINLMVGSAIASSQEEAVSSLNFADRLFQMPNGMIGAAFGVVLLPEVTRLLRSGDRLGANNEVGKGILFSMLLTLPAAVAFVCAPASFVGPIYERLHFTAEDTQQVSMALAAFAVGLPAYVLMKVLQTAYFARENTKSPMKIALVTVVVNALGSLILFQLVGFVGIAIATSLAGWVNVALLLVGLRGQLGMGPERRLKLIRTLTAAVLMGFVVWLGSSALSSWFGGAQWQKIVAMLLVVGLGGSTYGWLVLSLKATSLRELKDGFRR
ncbi:MAG: murein biosynthesis integral membrane protein MurJ [Verrucomicrobiales bacterium]